MVPASEGGADLKRTGDKGRTVFDGECHGLLGWQRVGVVDGVVEHVAAGGVGVQPLADVALIG